MSNTELTNIIEKAARLLINKNITIAFAESATAGRATAEFSLACDAGKFLKGAFVCYDVALKTQVLKVPQALVEKYTPESMEVTHAIAKGLESLITADVHIGITGLPCPGGSETPEKPVGTMFIFAIRDGKTLFAERVRFDGSHNHVLEQTVKNIAFLLVKHLS